MLRTFTFRLFPNAGQREALGAILADCQETYNAGLQERIEAWKLKRKSIRLYEQFGELTALRKEPQFARIAVDIQRDPLRRLDKAFKAFFRRCKAGEKPGFPRFRSRHRYDSFGFHSPRLKNSRINIPNFGGIRVKAHQAIRGVARFATIQRLGSKWQARIVCDIGSAPDKVVVSNAVGIDLGISSFVTLSDGHKIENPRWVRKHHARIAAANRLLARKLKRSRNHLRAKEILRRAHQRAADARKNFVHHVSKWLVSNYDLIAFEKLNIKGMVQSRLAKSILDAAWGMLIWQISYKAEYAGRYAIAVNPRGTSIQCSQCGEPVPKQLSERRHICACGANLDRDHNAALNILALGNSAAGLQGPSESILYSRYIIPFHRI